MSLQIRQLSYALGAEILGVDLREEFDEQTFKEMHAAFLQYSVLLFRKQPLTREQHLAFSKRFGAIEDHDQLVSHVIKDPAYRELVINKSPAPAATVWHSDRSFTCVPTMATTLRAIQIPDVGGDTMFSNMYLAYETLSDGMKKLIADVYAIHPSAKLRLDHSTPERLAESQRRNPPVAQPVVRVHPETGRKSLYIEEKVKQLVGMTLPESEPLVQFLCKHAARPQFVFRHQWEKDDLIMWDNRCTNHIAVADYDRSQIRHTEKTCVAGTPSGYAYTGPLEVSYF